MTRCLFDGCGRRKYLVQAERIAFLSAAILEDHLVSSFCLTLAVTGARISEVLSLTADNIDVLNEAIVFRTLKQRHQNVFRAVPVPLAILRMICQVPTSGGKRIWPWGRTTAWKRIKSVMRKAEIAEGLCKPKALRHAFAVEAGQKGVPLNVVQHWLGHARLETTAIYAGVLGEEERTLARRSWESFASMILK